ncbi:fasciclin-like arabinogalactan protein 11 [Amaranthus tricolor]|uniref:fasciclin-like arabinogalactan protein 11 n=1 Tax=Amaranthus tricolor TaxID=29722 RepID=UPI00258D66BD|nr:fasciclin-like arabinogalactan protein 11 [Amaranthus tricolor]
MSPFLAIILLQGLVLVSAQAQAPAPAPTGPTNITAILTKAGQYTMFMRLLQTTRAADQINTQLNNSNSGGLTIFAPTDNAFSNLKSGLLNSLSEQQKVQLVQFHIISNFLSISEFQTTSNPLRTQAGDSTDGSYALNVTTFGNQVNITSGVVNTTLSNSVYSDGQLAVYQVDQVLLPLAFFRSPAPAPAPLEDKPKKGSKDPETSKDDTDTTTDSSGVIHGFNKLVFGVLLVGSIVYVVL